MDINQVEHINAPEIRRQSGAGAQGATSSAQPIAAGTALAALLALRSRRRRLLWSLCAFLGLAGVGDLIVTCASPLSRNYRVGYALGKGQALEEILEELGQVAEGINTLAILKAESDRREVYMPLVNGLHAILYERQAIGDVIGNMMLAEQTQDVEFVTS